MGARQSTDEDKGAAEKVFDTDQIYYDADGNLRLGASLRDKELELKKVADADDPDDKPGKVWYIVDAQWMKTWLAYTHFNKVSPAPGPVRNDNLMDYDAETDEWTPKPDLVPATRSGEGHFRRVNKEVWDVYKELYEGSGPTIYVENGDPNDPANWLVEPGFKNKQVIKKRRKLRKSRKISKDRDASVENDDEELESKNDEEAPRQRTDSDIAQNPKEQLITGGATEKKLHDTRADTTAGEKSNEYVEDRTVSKQQRQNASAFFAATSPTSSDPTSEEATAPGASVSTA